jgi:hypothetical protein
MEGKETLLGGHDVTVSTQPAFVKIVNLTVRAAESRVRTEGVDPQLKPHRASESKKIPNPSARPQIDQYVRLLASGIDGPFTAG